MPNERFCELGHGGAPPRRNSFPDTGLLLQSKNDPLQSPDLLQPVDYSRKWQQPRWVRKYRPDRVPAFLRNVDLDRSRHFLSQTLNYRSAKKGLCTLSFATVVIGPCPGQMMVSGGRDSIFSRLFFLACSWALVAPPLTRQIANPQRLLRA